MKAVCETFLLAPVPPQAQALLLLLKSQKAASLRGAKSQAKVSPALEVTLLQRRTPFETLALCAGSLQ